MESCENCIFFLEKETGPSGFRYIEYLCRRFPPGKQGFPGTNEKNWCGEYRSKYNSEHQVTIKLLEEATID